MLQRLLCLRGKARPWPMVLTAKDALVILSKQRHNHRGEIKRFLSRLCGWTVALVAAQAYDKAQFSSRTMF